MKSKIQIRDDLNFLHGQMEALKYPFLWKGEVESQAYYDLIDSVVGQFEKIKEDVLEVFKIE